MKPFATSTLVALLTLAGAFACGSPQVGSRPAPKTQATTASVAAPTVTASPVLPTASLVRQSAGIAKAEYLADSTASVIARVDAGAFTYLRVRLNPTDAEHLARDSRLEYTHVMCEGSPNCLGVWPSAKAGASTNAPSLVLRLPRASAASLPNAIVLHTRASQLWPKRIVLGGKAQRFTLKDALTQDGRAEDLAAAFRDGLAQYLEFRGSEEPYVAFAVNRIRSRLAPHSATKGTARNSSNAEFLSAMNFYTGRGEIAKTLQTERGLGVSAKRFQPTVALSKVAGVRALERDYAALVAADRSVTSPRYSPLSNLLPPDSIVIEFSTVKDLVQLPKLFDERFDAISRALEAQPGTYRLVERYREQLIVEPSQLSEQLGHVAVGNVALVLGDPYLREGTDVSLVLEVRQRALVETVLAKYLSRAQAKFPTLETKSLQIEGAEVTLRATPDGRIRQYVAWSSDRLWLSNSPKRMAQLLRIAKNKDKSLQQTEDYRWARSVTPFDETKERAHLFFGDAFMTAITGPRSKILEARRTRAQNELRTVDYAALLHGMMEGVPAQSQKQLLASGWLTKKDLVHFDGSPITWSSDYGAASSWGRSSEMLPLIDLTITKVDPSEAKSYGSFRSDYEWQVRGALDPTSLRVLRTESPTELRTELRILPLLPTEKLSRMFQETVRSVGRGSVKPGGTTDGLSAVLAIAKNSPLRDLARNLLDGSMMKSKLALGFLGDWVKVGLAEDPIVLEGALREGYVQEIATVPATEKDDRIDLEKNLQRLPAWAAIQIQSRAMLTAALAAIRVASKEHLEDMVAWSEAGMYRDLSVSKVTIGRRDEPDELVSVYYAVVKDTLLLSLQRRVLELRMDDVLAGNQPQGTAVDSRSAQLLLEWSKQPKSILSAVASGMLERSAAEAHSGACMGLSLLAMGLGEQTANDLDGALALRYLGYEPLSPNGPGLKIVDGQCVHPIYGTQLEPVLPAAQDATIPLHRAIDRLRSIRFGVGAVPRKDEQEFFGTVDISFADE